MSSATDVIRSPNSSPPRASRTPANTSHPAAASRSVIARPIPRAAPVTSTVGMGRKYPSGTHSWLRSQRYRPKGGRMSQENVELVTAGYDDFNRGDIQGVTSRFDPEIEWV